MGRFFSLEARRSGEILLSIGGARVALLGEVYLEEEFVAGHAAGFVAEGPAELVLTVHAQPRPPVKDEAFDGLDVRFDVVGDSLSARRRDFELAVDMASGRGHLAVATGTGALSSALRIVLSRFLPLRHGAVLLHAAGAVGVNKSWVFFGPSGAGKSTVASQLRRLPLLSDEIVALAGGEDGPPTAFGTPFSGTLEVAGDPGGQPVGGLFLLGKGPALVERRLARRAAVAALMSSVLIFGEPGELAERALGICTRVAETVGVSELVLPSGKVVAAFLEQRMQRENEPTWTGKR